MFNMKQVHNYFQYETSIMFNQYEPCIMFNMKQVLSTI